MYKLSRKQRPIAQFDRYQSPGNDFKNEGVILVQTPEKLLVWFPGCSAYGDRIHRNRYLPVRLFSIALQSVGGMFKLTRIAESKRFDIARYEVLLGKIRHELQANVKITDIDVSRRKFTTVFS